MTEWTEVGNFVIAILGTGFLTSIGTLKYVRATAKADADKHEAEAATTKVEAAKGIQDMYQQMIDDMNKYRNDMRNEFEMKLSSQSEIIKKQAELITMQSDQIRNLTERMGTLESTCSETARELEEAETKLNAYEKREQKNKKFICYKDKCKQRCQELR